MKLMKKLLIFAILSLVLSLSLLSCSMGENNDKPSAEVEITGDYIFSPKTNLNLVFNGDHITHHGVSDIYYTLCDMLDKYPTLANDKTPEAEHEIVIGPSQRAISKEAYKKLENLERENSDYYGYVIYSNGKSVAIAYDEDMFNLKMAEDDALEYFKDNFLSEPVLRIKKGVAKEDLFNIVERQKALDAIKVNEAWQKAESTLAESVGEKDASAIIASFKNCYKLFTDDVIWWFANLYDPVIGGYYYSNSGRNTVGYGPDLESTYQALSFMGGTGMAEGIDTSKGEDVIPAWMGEQIVKFVKSLQDPVSGYFYHPQWGGESFDDRRAFIDNGYVSRKGRDLKWALSLLSRFGAKPTYNIMNVVGDGLLADGTPANKPQSDTGLTARLNSSMALAVSKVVPVNESIPTHLQSAENLRKYLEKQDVNGDSYYVGNLIESQSNQIVERDKQIGTSGNRTPLADVVKEYFDSHQNQSNGAWTLGNEITYESVNGILKICGAYNGVQKEFPNPIKAINTAMEGITIADPPTTVCFVLNPWYAITMLIQNVEKYNSSSNKGEVEEQIAALRGEILKNAVKLIDVTKEKTAKFRKDDGSFSYFPDTSGPNSQGVPVAVTGSVEGDVNATHMFISGIPNHIWGILGCDVVPIYTVSDRMRYWTILYELGGIIKDDVAELVPETYEEEELGSLPQNVSSQLGIGSKAEIMTTLDKNAKETRAVGLTTIPGNTDILRLPLTSYKPFYNAVVFEADIKIESLSGSGQIEMLPYGSPGDAYRIIIDYSKGGNVSIRNVSDFTSVVIGKEGEWINIKLQYSYADIDYDRNGTKDLYIKVFAGGKLVAEGYTPQGAEPVKESSVSGIRFFSWTAANATLFVDNTMFYQNEVELKPAPIVNPEDDSELITFEGSTSDNIPGKVATGDVTDSAEVFIKDIGTAESPDKVFGLISHAGAADKIKFYITKNAERYNAVALETDIMIEALSDSGEFEITLSTMFNSTASKLIFSYTKGGDITVKKVNASGEADFTEAVAKDGQWWRMRIVYTASTEGLKLSVYAGDVLIAEGTKLYNSFHAGENINGMTLAVKDTSEVGIYLDDLKFERTELLSDSADPDVGGITFEEGELDDVKDKVEAVVTDKATAEITEDIRGGRLTKALKLTSPKDSLDLLKLKLSAPADEEKDNVNTVVFEGNFKITDADAGNIITLYHKTADGDIANKIVFGWSASSGNIFVLNMYTVKNGSAKDFDTVVVGEGMNSYFRLKVEYTKVSDTEVLLGFTVNGTKVADINSAHPYESPAIDADDITEIVFETYSSRKTTLFVDNITVERTNVEVEAETPTPDTPVTPNPDTPVTPNPDVPAVPKDEYDGSIFDQETDGSISAGNWT
ncbi:MAG: hypothetical protein IKJ13_01120 [Clostridia bacterium]|nr:hypothetical protein [Clostridia bacterium]